MLGPDAPAAERNILGVVKKVGMDIAGKVLKMRHDGHALIKMIGGRAVHPNWGLPGGVSHGIDETQRKEIEARGLERSSSPSSRSRSSTTWCWRTRNTSS